MRLNEESYRMNAASRRSYLNNNIQILRNFPQMKCFCPKKKLFLNLLTLNMPKNDNNNKNSSDFLIV